MIANTLPRSLVDNPRIDQWIGFEAEGRVRVATGKVELGQGVLTALAQIAAEELDVGLERIRLISGDTADAPNEWLTAGSMSIEVGGASLRLVCAEVRSLFLARAAAATGIEERRLTVTDGQILRDGEPTGVSYWSLAPQLDLARKATGAAPVKRPADYRLVGRSVPRLDLPARIAGAPFIHDLAPGGMLHARVIRQPWPGARIGAFDETRPKRAGGDIGMLRIGDFLALTGASETAVAAAAELTHAAITWEGGDQPPDNVDDPAWLMRQPSVDRVLEGEAAPPGAPPVLTALYSRPYIAHGSIGTSCALARFEASALTIISHSQGVFPLRGAIARALALEPERIRISHHPGAGCYGHNGADDVAFDAALIAVQMPGRWIRVLWSRADELAASPVGAAMAIKLSAALNADKRPTDWRMEIWSPTHIQRPGPTSGRLLGAMALPGHVAFPLSDVPDAAGGGATRNALALYDLPDQRVIHHFIPEPPVRTSALRSLGAFANVFAIESFIDELAEAAAIGPLAFRLSILTDPRARAVIEKVAAMAGWEDEPAAGEGRAKGLAFARYKNGSAWCACVAEVAVDEEVRLEKVWCAVDGGLIINPDGARNQIEGGIIQGASWTLKEQVRFSGGRIVSASWEDYPVLRFSEVPEIEIALVEAPGEPALGLGEVAHGPIAAAIGNGVARALGARLRQLPLTRERIMAALLGEG